MFGYVVISFKNGRKSIYTKSIPYLVCPYELNPYQFFGVGIPENMEDSQKL